MTKQSEMANQQADDQVLLADESETLNQVCRQAKNCLNGSAVVLAIHYNRNKLASIKYY